MSGQQVKVEGLLVRESEKAICVQQGEKEFWIPRSQISYALKQPGYYECRIPLWLAHKKDGLDYEEID